MQGTKPGRQQLVVGHYLRDPRYGKQYGRIQAQLAGHSADGHEDTQPAAGGEAKAEARGTE